MAYIITDECINCGACEPECPNNAIYEGGSSWSYAEGTEVSGMLTMPDGRQLDANSMNNALEEDRFFIVPDKCTECQGFHEESQCSAVCPVDCCIPDPNHHESKDQLMAKKELLHA